MPDFRFAFRPFAEQQRYFARKVNLPSSRWDEIWQAEHAHGFMVAGVTRAAVLDDIRAAIQAALDQGEGFEAFRSRFSEILGKHGWIGGAGDESDARRAWRMRVIYRTNLRTSYMGGRWEQLQKFPFLRYQHNTVLNPREQHQGWDGLVLRSDDPWWDTHFPPNGWGCACTVTGVGPGRLRALGKSGPDPAPGPGPGDPPPEWAYHVGKAAQSLPAAASLGARILSMPDAWRKTALDDAQARSVQWLSDWPGFVREVSGRIEANAATPRGLANPLGFLPDEVVVALKAGRGASGRAFDPVRLDTALLAVTDRAVYHALRDQKLLDRPELREVFVAALADAPRQITQARAVLWDPHARHAALLFASPATAGGYLVFVVRPNLLERRAADPIAANWVRTIELRSLADLQRFILVKGELP